MAGCETMVCQTGTEERTLPQKTFRKGSPECDNPTTLQPEDPTTIPVSTCIDQMLVYPEDSVEKKQELIPPSTVESDIEQVALGPTPGKLAYYVCAALVCGMAIELGIEKAWEQNTCSALSQERTDLSAKLGSLSDELHDRMNQMSALLARETSENTRLRDELEHTKRVLKYFQGTAQMPEEHEIMKEDTSNPKARLSNWVTEVYDDSMYQVWKVRYYLSEGLRFVRTRLPSDMPVTKTLHDWEDAVAGPME